jgi:hypothetical protein
VRNHNNAAIVNSLRLLLGFGLFLAVMSCYGAREARFAAPPRGSAPVERRRLLLLLPPSKLQNQDSTMVRLPDILSCIYCLLADYNLSYYYSFLLFTDPIINLLTVAVLLCRGSKCLVGVPTSQQGSEKYNSICFHQFKRHVWQLSGHLAIAFSTTVESCKSVGGKFQHMKGR